jgi:hypothetical protein
LAQPHRPDKPGSKNEKKGQKHATKMSASPHPSDTSRSSHGIPWVLPPFPQEPDTSGAYNQKVGFIKIGG